MINAPATPAIVVSVIVIAILLFCIFVTIRYRNPDQYKQTRFNVFFSTLASLAILIVGFNIILTSLTFEYNQKFTRTNKTKEAAEKLWLYPNQLLVSSSNIRPEFLASFFMSNLPLYNMIILPNNKTELTKAAIIEEQFISNVMMLAWVDCLTIRRYDETPLTYWLRAFLTWAQNPYFKTYYERLKFGYDQTTVDFGNLLFEYAAKIPVPTEDTEIYSKTAEQMMEDPRFISLLKTLR